MFILELSMFKKLTDFSYRRNGKEACGFYLAYLLFIIIFSLIATALFSGISPFYSGEGLATGMRLGTTVAITSCLVLSFFIVMQKKLADDFGYILLALLSGLVASFGGGLFGLIIPAFLTTRKKKKN